MASPKKPGKQQSKRGTDKVIELSGRLDDMAAQEIVDAITQELADVTLENIRALKMVRSDLKNGAAVVAAVKVLDEYAKEFKPALKQTVTVKFA